MNKFKKYAKRKRIGKKHADIFSVGHFFKGFITFLLIYIVIERMGFGIAERYYCSLLGVIFVAILWESLENSIWIMIKPNGIDSLKNSLADIIFDIIGGTSAWILIVMINIANPLI